MSAAPVIAADPLHALWCAQGNPVPSLPWQAAGDACARCGDTTLATVRLVDVVSDKFTGWDVYTHTTGSARWCVACAWGHTDPALRQRSWQITTVGGNPASPADLRGLLSVPLDQATALTIPVGRKKHLLPSAQWGRVTTDDRLLPWGQREATRFLILGELRAWGFSEAALAEPVPRFEQLRTLGSVQQAAVLDTWQALDPWRADGAYLAVACRATRKDAP